MYFYKAKGYGEKQINMEMGSNFTCAGSTVVAVMIISRVNCDVDLGTL